MAKNYKEDFDYSEAIANTQDAGKRQELLAERQNKIDTEGLAGKVASNEAVSTWNGDYRPYSVSSGSSGGGGGASAGASALNRLYEAAEQARLKRFEAARDRIAQQLERNLASIESDYTAGMAQTDINARQSVLSNEEKLAALGLNMGARGSVATSGAAETSRISIDNQYRSDLNARAAAQDSAAGQEAALEIDYYAAAESAALSQAQAQLAQFNADRDYSLSVAGLTGFLNGTPTLNWRNYQLSVDDAADSAQTRAFEQALSRWKTNGYVLQRDAAILGVPAGTPTSDVSYQNASLALQKWKAGYWY